MKCFGRRIRTHHCKVVLLDTQELIQEIQDTTTGQELLDNVFKHLNLIETAYFGLRFQDCLKQTHWLDPSKKVAKQLKNTEPFTLYFGVKFYATDPCKLLEEITRYQFFLQIKQDILQGRLPINYDLAAEVGAYAVQSEMGDYDPRLHNPGYISEFRFMANQTLDLEARIAEIHQTVGGQVPAVAELNYLEKVKWLDMYGVDLHPVLGEENVEYFIGLTPSGVIVLRNKEKVGNYYWPRITKVYFKGRYFMLRVKDKANDENTYGFETPSKSACKHLWRCCVEHHAFFRLVQVSPTNGKIFTLGSRFRYSGRSEKEDPRNTFMRHRAPPPFTRVPSRRYERRIVEGALDTSTIEERAKPVESLKSLHQEPNGKIPLNPYHTNYQQAYKKPDSPRSTRSAPWADPRRSTGAGSVGYPSNPSPRSVRSAGTAGLGATHRRRSPSVESQRSVESQSSVDSRGHHRRHRNRKRSSDNESELSRSSSNHHRRHRSHRSRDSGSESEHHHHHRHKHRHSRHHRQNKYELVESEEQWAEVQRRQLGNGAPPSNTNQQQLSAPVGNGQQTSVPKDLSRHSGYINSGMETESEASFYPRRKCHKKHRSRSRSPSESKARLPDELRRHLEFSLIETSGMSEKQLQEIPYTVVETANITRTNAHCGTATKRSSKSPKRQTTSSTPPEMPQESCDNSPIPYIQSNSGQNEDKPSNVITGHHISVPNNVPISNLVPKMTPTIHNGNNPAVSRSNGYGVVPNGSLSSLGGVHYANIGTILKNQMSGDSSTNGTFNHQNDLSASQHCEYSDSGIGNESPRSNSESSNFKYASKIPTTFAKAVSMSWNPQYITTNPQMQNQRQPSCTSLSFQNGGGQNGTQQLKPWQLENPTHFPFIPSQSMHNNSNYNTAMHAGVIPNQGQFYGGNNGVVIPSQRHKVIMGQLWAAASPQIYNPQIAVHNRGLDHHQTNGWSSGSSAASENSGPKKHSGNPNCIPENGLPEISHEMSTEL